MDTTRLYDDEVVADSEEEDNSLELQFNESIPQTANVQMDPTVAPNKLPPSVLPVPTSVAPIATTDAQSSKSTKNTPLSEHATKPRPRPRPAYKKAVTNVGDLSSSGANPSTDPVLPPQSAFTSDIHMDLPSSTSNIADRAKMRSRKTKSNVVDIIELTSDEDELALPPVSKPRPKPKPKVNTKSKASPLSNGVPVPGLPRSVKPQTNKRSKTSHPTSPNIYATQDTLPIPTSSIRLNDFPIPFKVLSSQLPPSDPPTSTAATYDHPPIVTLPNQDTDMDIPSSSPSSLFSVPSSSRKRKRALQRVDELDSDREPDRSTRMDADAQMMPPPAFLLHRPPPSPFFTGSSPSPSNALPQVPPMEVVDLTMIPATAEPKLPPKKTPKPRKPRKKKGDDMRDGEQPEISKPAPKKPKASKKKLEVVIDERPKKKGKEKEKEAFKSREFIDDDDDDSVTAQLPVKKAATSTKPDSLTSLSSISDSEDDKQEGPSKQRQCVASKDAQLVTAKEKVKEVDVDLNEPDVSAKAPKKGKSKRVIVSDDEDEDEAIAVPSRKKGSTRVNAANKGKGKARSDALEDDASGDHIEVSIDGQSVADEEADILKENVQPIPPPIHTRPSTTPTPSLFPSLASRYTIAPRTKSTPMSELIRRVNSLPGSPFSTPRPRASGSSHLKASTPGTAYSPYLKSSKSLLSRIAPLHPNRRTPPPSLPPPPPPKKTKKEKEREEQWEEELVESVGGITEWACMTDAERKELRKAKWEREMSGWED